MKIWISFLLTLSASAQTFDMECGGKFCTDWSRSDEAQYLEQSRENYEMGDTAHVIFVPSSSERRGIAEALRMDTLETATIGISQYVLRFETVSGKKVEIPYLSRTSLESAQAALMLHQSIDISRCLHDRVVKTGRTYDKVRGCVRTYRLMQTGYACALSDRTPIIQTPVTEEFESLLSADEFQGAEREVLSPQCLPYAR